MTRIKNIVRLLLVAILLLLTAASASAQALTVFAGQTYTFEVDVPGVHESNIHYEIYDNFAGVNMATVPGNCPAAKAFFPSGNTGSSVPITWLVPGTYIVKVEAENACPTNNMEFYMVEVLPAMPTATLTLNPDEICKGSDADLIVTFSGTPPWGFILETNDGINPPSTTTYTNITDNPYIITVSPTTTTTYTVIEVSDANDTNTTPSNSVTITVQPKPNSSRIYQYEPAKKK